MCDLDPNSPPMEEDTPSDNDKDDADDADMLALTANQDADCYYSYDDFSFLDTRGEHDRFLKRIAFGSLTVKTSCISIRSISRRLKVIVTIRWVIVVWWAEQTLAIVRTCIYLWAKGRHKLYSSTITSS